jgi:hypothetical protein
MRGEWTTSYNNNNETSTYSSHLWGMNGFLMDKKNKDYG